MDREYGVINEQAARAAKSMNSFGDYIDGSATLQYRQYVDQVYDTAEQVAAKKPDLAEKAEKMAKRYSRRLAAYYNSYYQNEASCPSVLICGAANFPVKKKERQNSRRETLMADWEYLKTYAERIGGLLTGKQPILSGDEKALGQLEEKLGKLEKKQAVMKEVNAYYRKNKTLEGCPGLTWEQVQSLKTAMADSSHYADKPFMTFELTNNNAKIKNTRLRLERLKKEKEAGTQKQDNPFFTVVENKELMRLQLLFDGKPEAEVRDILKGNGFRWSPKNSCWQRQLTDNARFSVQRILKALEKTDSRK